MPSKPKPLPIYHRGRSAGYNESTRRWHYANGKIDKKGNVLASIIRGDTEDVAGIGATVNFRLPTPLSDAFVKYDDQFRDNIVKGAQNLEQLITYTAPREASIPQPLPSAMRATYNLAEYYFGTQGDVFQHVETPLDIAATELDIQCPDPSVKKMLEDLYLKQMGMRDILMQCWMSREQFGVAYPLEVFDDDGGAAIVMVPPRFMWVGYYIGYGQQFDWRQVSTPSSVPFAWTQPDSNTEKWTEELVKTTFHPMTYNAFGPNFNEQILKGWGIPIDPSAMHPIRGGKAYQFTRYPIPRWARAFNAISQRLVYYEMIRATLEGFRNQLWLFLLGDYDHPPTPKEVLALQAQLSGMAGERTGSLVWRGNLKVQVLVPEVLANALAPEVEHSMTLRIFRNMGANVRFVTGNTLPTGGQGGGAGIEAELSIFLARMDHTRIDILEWEKGFRDRWATKQGGAAILKAMEKTTVNFAKPLLSVGELIEKQLKPLYQFGLLDVQTTLVQAGYNYEAIKKRKDEQFPDREKWSPPPTFNQMATGGSGETASTTSQASPGRPTNGSKPVTANTLKAAWEDDEDRKKYIAAVLLILQDDLIAARDAEKFITDLKSLNLTWLDKIYQRVYADTGGVGTPNREESQFAARFVNSFADGFQERLAEAIASGEDLSEFAYRAMLYPQEGYKMAVMNAQMKAMVERGGRYWQRILHPERSKAGPCEYCVADSLIIHGYAEPFVVLHSNEKCEQQDMSVRFYTEGGLPSIEVPIPQHSESAWEMLRGFPTIVRRRRI